jgi:hypothetical protein
VNALHPEKFMSPFWLLSGTAAFALLYMLYRAMANYTGDDRVAVAGDRAGHAGVEEFPEDSYSSSNRIRTANAEDFFQSRQENFLFFDIWSGSQTLDSTWQRSSPISFDEFADSIPWIPLESKIVVRQVGGADAHFLKRIAALPTEREILVLVDKSADLATSVQHEGGPR